MDSIDVHLRHESGGEVLEKQLLLTQAQPTATWKVRTSAPNARDYTWRLVHHLADGSTREVEGAEATRVALLPVDDPFPGALNLTFVQLLDATRTRTKRAVVIGINDYSRQLRWPDGSVMWGSLNFCRPDADAIYHILLDAFGFDPAGITLLKDQSASSSNIRRAVAHMLAESEPGDVAMLYYSGHGGLHPGSREGTYYQTIIPATGRWITDWDLWRAADALRPSEVNFTVVMDSCHSGGMGDPQPDGTAAKTAALSQELIATIVSKMNTVVPFGIALPDIETLSNNVQSVSEAPGPVACYLKTANQELAPTAKATLLSAARWDESALESSAVGHGYLTQAIIDTVNACPYTASHLDLHSRLHTRVHELSEEMQSPVLRVQASRAHHSFLAPFAGSG